MLEPEELRKSLECASRTVEEWYQTARSSARGPIVVFSAGFAVLEALKLAYPPPRAGIGGYVTERNQVRMSIGRFKRIVIKTLELSKTEGLHFPREGGRTTRSAPGYADQLANLLESQCGVLLKDLSDDNRGLLASELQRQLAEHYEQQTRARQQLNIEMPDVRLPLAFAISQIIAKADDAGKAGPVSQHLVGAKLALRYRDEPNLSPRSATAADEPTRLPGDFLIGNTVFHVTVAPNDEHFEKCRRNLQAGYRVWILVPEKILERARGMAQLKELEGRIAVHSIEWFVGQNLEEIGEFKLEGTRKAIRDLIETYNSWVQASGDDPSLMLQLGG